mgnify:FL=1
MNMKRLINYANKNNRIQEIFKNYNIDQFKNLINDELKSWIKKQKDLYWESKFKIENGIIVDTPNLDSEFEDFLYQLTFKIYDDFFNKKISDNDIEFLSNCLDNFDCDLGGREIYDTIETAINDMEEQIYNEINDSDHNNIYGPGMSQKDFL